MNHFSIVVCFVLCCVWVKFGVGKSEDYPLGVKPCTSSLKELDQERDLNGSKLRDIIEFHQLDKKKWKTCLVTRGRTSDPDFNVVKLSSEPLKTPRKSHAANLQSIDLSVSACTSYACDFDHDDNVNALTAEYLQWETYNVYINVALEIVHCVPPYVHVIDLYSILPQKYSICSLQWTGGACRSKNFCSIAISNYRKELKSTQWLCKEDFIPSFLQINVQCPEKYLSVYINITAAQEIKSLEKSLQPTVKDISAFPKRVRRSTNQPPVFNADLYEASIAEELSPGQFVKQITASDPDTGLDGDIKYSLSAYQDIRTLEMFQIDETNGQITTKVKLNREDMDKHYMYVLAKDGGLDPKSASATVIVHVIDVNDHAPQFEKSVYNINISENMGENLTVQTIKATDADAGDNQKIRYQIINNVGGTFSVDPESGTIITLMNLDREKTDFYEILLTATDQGEMSTRKTSTATISITVTDVNDNKPQFTQSVYSVSIPEDRDYRVSPFVVQVSATDLDIGVNKEVVYSIYGGNEKNAFNINSNTGVITLQSPLNRESVPSYLLNVRGQNLGTPTQANTATVNITITDINDCDPIFFNAPYQVQVKEDTVQGTVVLGVHAKDDDAGVNAALTYSLVNIPDVFPFTLDQTSGDIRVSQPLDRETTSQYTFQVKAQDGGSSPRSAVTSVTIILLDVNDNTPKFEKDVYNVSVREDANIGEIVQVVLRAKDEDEGANARLTYNITQGNTGEAFQLSTLNGEGLLKVNKKLSYNSLEHYTLTIQATDGGGLYSTATLQVNILDTNKYPPIFQGTPYEASVFENVNVGYSVFKVFAQDQDRNENGRVSYEISQSKYFVIDPIHGVISTNESLDREKTSSETFSVIAKDHGIPQRIGTTDVVVEIKDVNDNKPIFEFNFYSGNVSEDVNVGKSVLQVKAADMDAQANGQVSYHLQLADKQEGKGEGDFEIDPTLGIIRTAQELDRETISVYYLLAVAMDGGNPPLSSTASVTIVIDDVNDSGPKFDPDVIVIYVNENTPRGTVIGHASAVDPDEGKNSQIDYEFFQSADSSKFSLTYKPGEPASIKNNIELDYDSGQKVYELKVIAKSGHFIGTAIVTIFVQDVNDNSPELKDFTIIFNNYEYHFISGVIGRVPVFDKDESDQNRLRYQFLDGNDSDFLHLNQSTGEITLDYRLDSDVPRNSTMHVTVTDGRHEVKKVCKLFVRLITPEMLLNSVTIRLNNMTESAFLSPLYEFFVDMLATILQCSNEDIIVFNIQNDTETTHAILNVSVSVRKQDGTFFSVQHLREQIYLQRSLLANVTTLQVLPFDDNLCVVEPCAYFAKCESQQTFDYASPFIFSDTMLFRSIHPKDDYRCVCPKTFTGNRSEVLCDIEVDFCYSQPCLNGATCVRSERGYTCICSEDYTGDRCEISQTQKYTSDTCPSALCPATSVCDPLIKGGFRCRSCPDEAVFTNQCQLKARRFSRGSYITYNGIKSRNYFTIQLKFATQRLNGLLLYNGRFNDLHDFIALELINGQLVFSFSLGNTTVKVESNMKDKLNSGQWHQVKVIYSSLTVTMAIGEDCDIGIETKYGHLISNNSCVTQVTLNLPSACENPITSCHRLFDLTGPLHLGGLTTSLPRLKNKDYEGCISDVLLDSRLLDLNDHIRNVGTQEGCELKREQCRSSPCQYGGTCREGWGQFYLCDCPVGFAGRDCSTKIEPPDTFTLRGNGYLMYTSESRSFSSSIVNLMWYNGISFRTRQTHAALMYITLTNTKTLLLEIQDGYLHYTFSHQGVKETQVFEEIVVNDGKWHYFEIRWATPNFLYLLLDYGYFSKQVSVSWAVEGERLDTVYVGAVREGNGPITKGFIGCVQNIRVANNPNSLLTNPSGINHLSGCQTENLCLTKNPCPSGATCIDLWGDYSCACPPGTMGPHCLSICQNYNPCNMATCRGPAFGDTIDYRCECGTFASGQYCETLVKPCPAAWYGYPVCGPCNCSLDLGFNPTCNKTNGACSCRDNYYRPVGSDRCLPCDCYMYGSESRTCHLTTGQCPCLSSVVGRRCDQCQSKYAEILFNKTGCKVNGYMCPRIYTEGVWWNSVPAGNRTKQDCPKNAIGDAIRECSADQLWKDPNLFACRRQEFEDMMNKFEESTLGGSRITTFIANTTMKKLHGIVKQADALFGQEITIAYKIMSSLLSYERKQKGLSLTSEQDSVYVKNMMEVLSVVLDTKYAKEWTKINAEGGGTAELLGNLEEYLRLLTENLEMLQSKPYSIVTENIVLMVDNISKQNFSGMKLPKFDNIVYQQTFDDKTSVFLPKSSLLPITLSDIVAEVTTFRKSTAFFGLILFKSLGNMLPAKFSSNIRQLSGRPLDINSPLVTIHVRDNKTTMSTPIQITYKQTAVGNRTFPQCAFWQTNHSVWSSSGCSVLRQFEVEVQDLTPAAMDTKEQYVVCSCDHMTTFGLVMDIADKEYVASAAITLKVFSFIGVGIAMVLIFVCWLILISFKRLHRNSNSILVNLMAILFLIHLSFLVGVEKVEIHFLCRLVSVFLHYFYLAAFSWLFVEMLHLYRRLTELRDINQGTMKFYYLLGYVIPGIIVGLALGIYTDGYKGEKFCWMNMNHPFIWSFAGPVAVAVVVIIVLFVLALKATFNEKIFVEHVTAFRMRIFCGMTLLLLLGLCWILGLLSVNYDSTPMYYIYAVFTMIQGVFCFLAYIVGDSKVRFNVRKQWYKCRGKKLEMEDTLVTPKGSKSALAYHSDVDGHLNHTMNMGISTTSTTSRSSKSSEGPYRGQDYLRSTSTSTSGHVPSDGYYHGNTGLPPYGLNPNMFKEKYKGSKDSDSESDASEGHNSLSLASSHSSDDDEDFTWEKQITTKAAKELEKKQSRRDQDPVVNPPVANQQVNNNDNANYRSAPYRHWPGDPNLSGQQGREPDPQLSDQHTVSSMPPDVLLATQHVTGMMTPPLRSSNIPGQDKIETIYNKVPGHDNIETIYNKVPVLTHNGSISSADSEFSHETSI